MGLPKQLIALGAAGIATTAAAFGWFDFGAFRDHQLEAHANQLFGIVKPIDSSSTESVGQATAESDPTTLVTLAKGLRARVVTARETAGPNIDMMALWPNDQNPTHLIACNEDGTASPGLVRIELATGKVSTIVTGTTSCDPTRRTPWGTP